MRRKMSDDPFSLGETACGTLQFNWTFSKARRSMKVVSRLTLAERAAQLGTWARFVVGGAVALLMEGASTCSWVPLCLHIGATTSDAPSQHTHKLPGAWRMECRVSIVLKDWQGVKS